MIKQAFVLFAISFFLTSAIGCNSSRQSTVWFEKHCFYVELARTPEERARGLMFREHLDPDKGMLFIFDWEAVHPFWMKNTLIPLDIIWINRNGEVVFISKDTQPCEQEPCPTINPYRKAKYVLEVCGGTADNIGLAVGDKLTLHIR